MEVDEAWVWDFAARLKKARQDAGLSQGEAAKIAGVSRVTISQIENGHHGPHVAVFTRLVVAYKASAEAILGLR